MPAQAARSPPLAASVHSVSGMCLLLLVAAIWVASSAVSHYILVTTAISDPFVLTYICTALFTVFLAGFLFVGRWRALLRAACGDAGGGGLRGGAEGSAGPMPLGELARKAVLFSPMFFGANYLFNVALDTTSVSSSTVLSSTSALWTLVLGTAFKTEAFTYGKVAAAALSIGGVALVAIDGRGERDTVLGNAAALGSAATYACYVTYLRRSLPDESRVSLPMFFGVAGLVCAAALSPVFAVLGATRLREAMAAPFAVWATVVGNALVGSVLSTVLWSKAVFLTSPLVATFAMSLTIPFALLVDSVLGWRSFEARFVVGTVLVASAFVLADVSTREGEQRLLAGLRRRLRLRPRGLAAAPGARGNARRTAIAIETLDGKGTVRRALLEDCLFNPAELTNENAQLLADFERSIDKNQRVISLSAIRAFRNTGAASPRSESAADEVRRRVATHHAAFPMVAIVTRRTTSAPIEVLRLDAGNKTALVRYGNPTAQGAPKAPSTTIEVRVVLCCQCERSVHGDFIMPWSHFDTGDGAPPQGTASSPARVLSRQLSTALKQLERFLAAPPSQFSGDASAPLMPLRTELQSALRLLDSAQRSRRNHHAALAQPQRVSVGVAGGLIGAAASALGDPMMTPYEMATPLDTQAPPPPVERPVIQTAPPEDLFGSLYAARMRQQQQQQQQQGAAGQQALVAAAAPGLMPDLVSVSEPEDDVCSVFGAGEEDRDLGPADEDQSSSDSGMQPSLKRQRTDDDVDETGFATPLPSQSAIFGLADSTSGGLFSFQHPIDFSNM
eukprot:m51a1_g3790 hypothetical protein (789) ;mRNA; r:181453-185202